MIFLETPFARASPVPLEGTGLSPILRHPAMMIHPPMLYSGYTLFAVPFAFAVGALVTRRLGTHWIRTTRPFALAAWLCLGMGIVLGARWSYSELGWGGYWAWDGVENAALMPWLTGTAFLHSAMVQERRGMLKVWNVSLVLLTGILALLGTFLVRSGILESIHAFGASTLGVPFLVLIVSLVAGSIALVIARAPDNAERQQVTVTLPGSNVAVPAMTALREWVRFAVRTPDGPSTRRGVGNRLSARQVNQGRALFAQAGCANCHGTNLFTNSRRLPPPPPAAEVFTERTGVFTGNPVGVQFVNRLLSNIGSFNLGVPGGGNEIQSNVGADEITNAAGMGPQDALGRDYNNDGAGNGYNIPSLLGIDNVQPYYHNGACESLPCVVSDGDHRTANGTQPDRLTSARDRARVVAFLRSID